MIRHRVAVLLAALLVPAGAPAAVRTLTRNVEPVVVPGFQTPALAGWDVTRLVVFRYSAASGAWTQIPFQVDERTPAGSYFSADDGVWDANDEISCLAEDAGDQAPGGAWPSGVDQTTRYEIAATDPLTGNAAWAYLFTAPSVTPVATQYMTYSGTATNTITGTAYSIDFLDGKPNVETALRVLPAGGGDGADLLDRSKTRVHVLLLTYTEEDLNSTIVGAKLGPVRFIERFTSKLSGFDALDATAFYYPDYIRTTLTVISSFFDISWLRFTYDFNETLTGLRHFDDSGAAGGNGGTSGIPIDGVTDNLSLAPLGQWWEVDSPHGCYMVVGDYSQAPVETMRFWYQDGGTDPNGSTGSDGLFGECGAYFTNAQNTTFPVETWSFMLPANQGNVGDRYEGYYRNPLAIAATQQAFVTAVGHGGSEPALGPAHPNPFHDETHVPISFDGSAGGGSAVWLDVTDARGRVVRRLSVPLDAGGRGVGMWDGRDDRGEALPRGVYLYRLSGARAPAGRLLLLR